MKIWTSGTIQGDDYYWMGNGNPIEYTNWHNGEPNEMIYHGQVEKCLGLGYYEDFTWNDAICDDELYFIREAAAQLFVYI